jgi:hypothetical protein
MAGPAYSVRKQADDVSHVIQYETLRKEICAGICLGTVERDLVMLQLDELHTLALKPAVTSLESESAGQISKMKTWVMSACARSSAMAQVSDSVLLTFIAKELMRQDVRLAEDIEVDEKFATFLACNNAVQKSLAATHALNICWREPWPRPGPETAEGLGLPQVPLRAQPEGLHIPSGGVDAQRPPQPQLAL